MKKKKYLTVSTRAIPLHPVFLEIHKILENKEFLDIKVVKEKNNIGKLIKITFRETEASSFSPQ